MNTNVCVTKTTKLSVCDPSALTFPKFPQLADNGRKHWLKQVGLFNKPPEFRRYLCRRLRREMLDCGLSILHGRVKIHLGLVRVLDIRKMLPRIKLVSWFIFDMAFPFFLIVYEKNSLWHQRNLGRKIP